MTVSETALEDDRTQLLQLNKSALVDAVSLGQEVTMGMYFVFSCLACRQFVHFEGVCSVSLFEKSLGVFGMGKMFRSFFCFAVTDSESLVEEDNREPFQQNTCAQVAEVALGMYMMLAPPPPLVQTKLQIVVKVNKWSVR